MKKHNEYPNGLSLVCICKNEQEHIAGMLASALSYADEVIVTDTGSTDMTIPIIQAFVKKFQKRVTLTHFGWKQDFAAARNHGIPLAKYRWLMWMDADDRIRPCEDLETVRDAITKGELSNKYVFSVCVVSGRNEDSAPRQIRMWPNGFGIKFIGEIHEILVTPNDRDLEGFAPFLLNADVRHLGYNDTEVWKAKMHRNYEFLETAVKKYPKDQRYRLLLANTYIEFGTERPAEADEWRKKALDLFQGIVKDCADDDTLGSEASFSAHFMCAQWYGLYAKDFDKALAWAKECITLRPREMTGYISAAQALFCLQRFEEASDALQLCEEVMAGKTLHWIPVNYDNLDDISHELLKGLSMWRAERAEDFIRSQGKIKGWLENKPTDPVMGDIEMMMAESAKLKEAAFG